MSTLLGPAVVLVALIATLRIALSQPDQTATTKTRTRRGPDRAAGPARAAGAARAAGPARAEPARAAEPAPSAPARAAVPRGRSASPVGGAGPMPAGFRWMDATPAPRVRSGLALVVILAFLGALLAMAVAGLAAAVAVAVQGI